MFYHVYPLKDKKVIIIIVAFKKVLNEFGCKTNVIWVDKGNMFYKRPRKSWLKNNDIEMYN